MNALNTLVLAKLVKEAEEKEVRKQVEPGVYEIDLHVHVHGSVNVGVDYDKAPTVSIPLKETMALLLHRMGCTREKAKEILVDVLTAAITEKGKGEGSIYAEFQEEIEAAEEHVKEIVSALPRTPCKGPVKLAVEYEEVVLKKAKKKGAA